MSCLTRFLANIGVPSEHAALIGHTQEPNITATGNNQATAYQLSGSICRITGGAIDTGVKLFSLAMVKAIPVIIFNDTGSQKVIYSATGEYLLESAGASSLSIASKNGAMFWPINTTTWVYMV